MSAIDDAQEEVKPDMTPMIDVVFLLIIFFICIDFKVLESKLPAFLPKDKGSQTNEVKPQEQMIVKIRVENDGTKKYDDGISPGEVNKGTGRPHRFRIEGHKVFWEVGSKPIHTMKEVEAELDRIAKAPTSMVDDEKTGGKKLIGVVIEPYPGTYYEDVAKTTDAVKNAKFEEINFGGGLGAK